MQVTDMTTFELFFGEIIKEVWEIRQETQSIIDTVANSLQLYFDIPDIIDKDSNTYSEIIFDFASEIVGGEYKNKKEAEKSFLKLLRSWVI